MRRATLGAWLLAVLAALPAGALETDQFYAWKRPLADATEAINVKINADIADALADVNARLGADACTCAKVQKAIRHRIHYLLFLKPEVWATNTATIERVPATPEEELAYRKDYLYGATSALDPIRFMPPSPTILVNGVRIGTDKLSHFFSEGAWLLISYRYYLKKGRTEEQAVERALNLGLASEKSILGYSSSGVLSLADIEANYQGLLFWKGLCQGPDPALRKTDAGWILARPFDIGPYVSPEWDESWQPSVYTASRWKKVQPVMQRYCSFLDDPEIRAQREDYARRSRYTVSEAILHDLVVHGKLDDPSQYSIEVVCGHAPRDVLAPPPVPSGDHGGAGDVGGVDVRPGGD